MGAILQVKQSDPTEAARAAAEVMLAGGVVVLPTDSVYGICCAATPGNAAHERIFSIKRRDRAQTLPWFIHDADGLARYGRDVPAWALRLAQRYWPGVLTLVVRTSKEVPAEYAQQGEDGPTIALRVPGSALVRAVVGAAGVPLAQTSANTHGMPAATSCELLEPAVVEAADLVLDAGAASVGVASTIVDATGEEPRVLREGALSSAEVLRACVVP